MNGHSTACSRVEVCGPGGRKKNKEGNWQYSVLVTTLSPNPLHRLVQQPTLRPLPALLFTNYNRTVVSCATPLIA